MTERKFVITHGCYKNWIATFETFNETLEYIRNEIGADNVVENQIQIDELFDDDYNTFTEFEIYDLLRKMRCEND